MTQNSREPIMDWLSGLRGTTADLPHSARSIALAILTHVNPQTGMTPPMSYADLRDEAGVSRGTLVAALRLLEDAGIIRRFGAHEQRNVYSLAVDNAATDVVDPGTNFAPTPVPSLAADQAVAVEFAPTPVQILDHERNLFSSSSLSAVDADDLGIAALVPLPRDWAPNPQHLAVVATRGLDLAVVVAAFREYAVGKKRRGGEGWDKAFGWWIKPQGGWDKHVASQAAAVVHAPSVTAPADPENRTKRDNVRAHSVSVVMRTLAAQGISGASVRDRAVELLAEGNPVYEIACMIEEELFALPAGA